MNERICWGFYVSTGASQLSREFLGINSKFYDRFRARDCFHSCTTSGAFCRFSSGVHSGSGYPTNLTLYQVFHRPLTFLLSCPTIASTSNSGKSSKSSRWGFFFDRAPYSGGDVPYLSRCAMLMTGLIPYDEGKRMRYAKGEIFCMMSNGPSYRAHNFLPFPLTFRSSSRLCGFRST